MPGVSFLPDSSMWTWADFCLLELEMLGCDMVLVLLMFVFIFPGSRLLGFNR